MGAQSRSLCSYRKILRPACSSCPISAHGSRPQHPDAPGIQPGEARLRASKAMRVGVSTKKRVPASLIRRFAQINCYGGTSRMDREDGGGHCGGSF
ncbi:MAG: hypothetical protein WA130_11095 [Candidatus Methanoperedens sp.]